jgi:hypothetical protein
LPEVPDFTNNDRSGCAIGAIGGDRPTQEGGINFRLHKTIIAYKNFLWFVDVWKKK